MTSTSLASGWRSRLLRLGAHVTQGSAALGVAPHEGLTLLTDDEVAEFIRDGFWSGHISELPAQFHTQFGERMRELWQAPREPGHDHGWLELEPRLVELLCTPTFKGALTSLLGRDFQMAAPWANMPNQGGMIGLHVTNTTESKSSDQQFHKDGTDHGNTQSTVRDLRQRQVIMMYYPLGASLAQGPTAVVPKSHYYALDRGESPGASEISLNAEGPMPVELVERDTWLQASADLIGGSAEQGFTNHLVTVPPGSVVITHHQLFHRASRAEEGQFRPMVKLGAARISEPRLAPPPRATPTAVTAPSGAQSPMLLQAMWSYTQGASRDHGGGASVSAAEEEQEQEGKLSSLQWTLRHDSFDVRRCEAAHALGALAAAAADDQNSAMTALLESFRMHLANEGASRNAMYGLCASGVGAVGPACVVLTEASVANQADETACGWKL